MALVFLHGARLYVPKETAQALRGGPVSFHVAHSALRFAIRPALHENAFSFFIGSGVYLRCLTVCSGTTAHHYLLRARNTVGCSTSVLHRDAFATLQRLWCFSVVFDGLSRQAAAIFKAHQFFTPCMHRHTLRRIFLRYRTRTDSLIASPFFTQLSGTHTPSGKSCTPKRIVISRRSLASSPILRAMCDLISHATPL